MTKVTLRYDLLRPLSDDDMSSVAATHATYGMSHVQVAAARDKIVVDYDASRLSLIHT